MCVFVKTAEVEEEIAQAALPLAGRKPHEALELEIKDYNAARAGMLKVAKLRLAMDDPSFDWLGYRQEIIDQHAKAPRVMRYLDTLNQFAISARR